MTTQHRRAFAARLRELREHAGLTQASLAEKAGLHLSAITRFEQGLREPTLATAAGRANALGPSVDELLKLPESEAPASRPRGRPPKQSASHPPARPKKPTAGRKRKAD